KHFEGLTPNISSGFWKMGGGVLEMLKKDVYTENEVWDFSKVQIYPFKCAFRYPVDA
ncbi:hypothetical protein LCER1_G007780, partial [Lachnellula cervina]